MTRREMPSTVIVMMALSLGWGCDDGTTFVPYTGTLQVVTATTGDAIDADGYELTLDDEADAAIGVADTVSMTLDVAEYAVGLTGLDAPCVVDGDNPVAITVVADETVAVSFAVVCETP